MCNKTLADRHADKGEGSSWAKRKESNDLHDARTDFGRNYTARRVLPFQSHLAGMALALFLIRDVLSESDGSQQRYWYGLVNATSVRAF